MLDLTGLKLQKVANRFFLIVFVAVFMVSGCSVLEKSGAWVEPEVTVVASRLTGLTLNKAMLELELDVNNANHYAIVLGALDFQLNLQDVKVLAGQQLQGNSLAAGKSQKILLPLEVDFADLSRLVSNSGDLNALNYGVSGGMTFDLPVVGPLRVPYKTQGEIPVPRLPEFSLVGLEQKSLSLTGANLVVSLALDNPNAFDLLVNKLQYSLKLNGHSITSGSLTESIELAAAGKSQVDIPINLAFGFSSVSAFYDLLRKGGQLDYELDLNSDLGTSLPLLKSLPFDAKRVGKVQLVR